MMDRQLTRNLAAMLQVLAKSEAGYLPEGSCIVYASAACFVSGQKYQPKDKMYSSTKLVEKSKL
jgi:hypothetical protein